MFQIFIWEATRKSCHINSCVAARDNTSFLYLPLGWQTSSRVQSVQLMSSIPNLPHPSRGKMSSTVKVNKNTLLVMPNTPWDIMIGKTLWDYETLWELRHFMTASVTALSVCLTSFLGLSTLSGFRRSFARYIRISFIRRWSEKMLHFNSFIHLSVWSPSEDLTSNSSRSISATPPPHYSISHLATSQAAHLVILKNVI